MTDVVEVVVESIISVESMEVGGSGSSLSPNLVSPTKERNDFQVQSSFKKKIPIDTLFCTPYDSSFHSSMMISLRANDW